MPRFNFTGSGARRVRALVAARPRALFGASLALAVLIGAAVAVGVYEADRIKARLASLLPHAGSPVSETHEVNWTRLETALLTLERADIPLGNVDGNTIGGGIATFADHLIHVSPKGYVGALPLAGGRLTYSDTRLSFGLTPDAYADRINFNPRHIRVHDILVRPVDGAEPTRAEILVSHHRFVPESQSVCLVVSRGTLTREDADIVFPQTWEEVYRLDACVSMPAIAWNFDGLTSGGEMVWLDGTRLLLSVGDFSLYREVDNDAVTRPAPDNDLGKIVELDLETGAVTPYAQGVRNPQGLAWGVDGRLWETEHGPQGGDEVNLIRRGGDYGWPHVSMGTEYGAPRSPLPAGTASLGRHEGYTRPAFAFVPSIGISGLSAVEAKGGFDPWHGDLVAASLREQSLYRLRPADDRIVYAEKIPLGLRLRDVIQLPDGRLAALSDLDTVVLLRGVSPSAPLPDTPELVLAGLGEIAPREVHPAQARGTEAWGLELYRAHCQGCHRLDGVADIGPPLNGILDANVGGHPGFAYSPALAAAERNWTARLLSAYISDPDTVYPGTTMPAFDFSELELDAMADFLATTTAGGPLHGGGGEGAR